MISGSDPKSTVSSIEPDSITSIAEFVTSSRELEAYASEWNELLSSSKSDTIFLTWEWISTWLEAVYPDAPLFVVVVRNSKGRLIAIAPFYLSEFCLLGLVKYRCLRVIGDCQSGAEYGDIIIRRGYENVALTCILQELMKHCDVWDCIWICNVAGWTGVRDRFRYACRELCFHIHKWNRTFSSAKLPGTYDDYLKLLSRNRRQQIGRNMRRFEELHDLELVGCDFQDKLPQLLSDLFLLHRKRWENVGQAGSFVRRPPMKQFYESFAPVALRKDWLRLWALKVNGIIRAIQYGYAYKGVFSQLQEGYEPEGFDGIGNILRNLVLKECIQERLHEYDFLGGFTEHKRRWGAESREGCDLLIGRRSLKNSLMFWKKVSPRGRFIEEGRPANQKRALG